MLVLHSLLLLLLVSLTTANRCPDPDDLGPSCSCSIDKDGPKTSCNKIRRVEELRKVFSDTGDHPLVVFELQKSVMSYFPASALKEKRVQQLQIAMTSMVGLFDRVPEENNKLQNIMLFECNILRGIEWSLLRNLNNLTGFYTGNMTIRSLDKEFMENMPTGIQEITMLNSGLSKINGRAFEKFTQLTSLGLLNGKITTLKRTMFPIENSLLHISFEDNQISELPDDIFSDMPKLKFLSLKDNLLKTISETIFSKIGKNVELVLSGNKIHCDCDVRWVMKREWKKFDGKCLSPKNFKDKALVGGISDDDLEYCNDL